MGNDRAKDIRAAGDAFVTRAVVVLTLIHLLIFPPLPKEQRDINQFLGNELRRVTDQRGLLERDFATIESEIRYSDRENLPKSGLVEQSLASEPTYRYRLERESLQKTRKYVMTAIEKNAEQIATLAKAKYVREFKIPGTESAMDESRVRAFYPIGLSAILLIVVFRYRNPLLQVLGDDPGGPPVWAAPLPYGRYNLNFWECTLLNVGWLSVVAIAIRLFLNASVRREFFTTPALYTANLVAGSFCVATYLVLLITAIAKSRPKESGSAA